MSDTCKGETANEAGKGDADSEGEGADVDVSEEPDSAVDDATPAASRDEEGKSEESVPKQSRVKKPHWLRSKKLRWLRSRDILAAVIGALATFAIGAASIWYAGEQSVEEFRREQRQAQYALILSRATDLKNATEVAGSNLGILGSDGNSYSYGNPYVYPFFVNGDYVPAPQGYARGGGSYTATDYYANNSPFGSVRSGWQSTYAAMDQAIAEAQIAGTPKVLEIARALRDSYRRQYVASMTDQLDAVRQATYDGWLRTWEAMPPEQRGPLPTAPKKLADMSEDEREAELNQIIGVGKPDPNNLGYDDELAGESSCILTGKYVTAAKDGLKLDDEASTEHNCPSP